MRRVRGVRCRMGTATGFGVGARWRAVLGVGVTLALVAPGVGLAADPDLAMHRTELYGVQPGWDPPVFGWRVAGGDFDGDGYSDIALTEPGVDLVLVLSGSARGVRSTVAELSAQTFNPTGDGIYGHSLAVGDTNGDGYDDLGVGVHDAPGKLAVYLGGPDGLSGDSERVLTRPEDGSEDAFSAFGIDAAGGGDMDGDGYAELLVPDLLWGKTSDSVAGSGGGVVRVFRRTRRP